MLKSGAFLWILMLCRSVWCFNFRITPSLSSLHLSPARQQNFLAMHFNHDHSHDHDHDHDHGPDGDNGSKANRPERALSLWGLLCTRPASLLDRPLAKVLIAATLTLIPAILRKSIRRIDVGIFFALASTLMLGDKVKLTTKKWIAKIKTFQQSLVRHSTPITRKYFFKNENAADRVTLLGVAINVVLAAAKFFGGIAFNSAVLVADAGHSLSDLVSDFITLWAVQIARLPADEDHPYGHGKFETVGSLFLSLTLLAAGVSVGVWSYDKMHVVLMAQVQALSLAHDPAQALVAMRPVATPSWPALALAALSIGSKEWLFRITRRVGQALNSPILVANAWHHRSDAFSSVLSLVSIAVAILVPGWLAVDSAAGILVAGMICLTGAEILFESVKQLTDTSDTVLAARVAQAAKGTEGVLEVKNVRARTVGSSSLVDLTVLTDVMLSSSAAQAISERVRWRIMEENGEVVEAMVRTQSTGTLCPLLARHQRTAPEVERDVRQLLSHRDDVQLRRVNVHFVSPGIVCVEVLIAPPEMSAGPSDVGATVAQARETARSVAAQIRASQADITRADVHLDLAVGGESAEAASPLLAM